MSRPRHRCRCPCGPGRRSSRASAIGRRRPAGYGFGSWSVAGLRLPGVTPCLVLGSWLAGGPVPSRTHDPAGTVRVAVAANFATTQARLAATFEAGSGHRVVPIVGSTGQLYAQVLNGAPFDVFLSADRRRIDLLEAAGAAVGGTRFTYALGRLVLFAPSPDSIPSIEAVLRGGHYRRFAVTNAATAPYGEAAMQVIDRLGLRAALAPKLVRGENVTQTLQFVKSGAAEAGFVAWSQVLEEPSRSWAFVPDSLYSPIAQDAVLLAAGETNPAARAYLAFLRGDVARRIIRSAGYDTR